MPDLSHHLNAITKRRKPSPLKELAKYMSIPGMCSLAGGMPFPAYLPFNSVDVEYQLPASLDNKIQSTEYFDIAKYGSKDKTGIDLAHLLQYGAVEGHPTLLKYVKELISIGIDPPSEWDTLVTCGSTDGLNKILLILAEEGDKVLVEKFTYASFTAAAAPLGVTPIAIDIDDQGMSATDLRHTLDDMRKAEPDRDYHGCSRKKELMNIANEYDLLIIEDDPYMFLQFDAKSIDEVFSDQTDSEFTCSDADSDFEEIVNCATNKVASAAIGDIASSSDERAFCKRYFETLVPSMLKFDTQGRVFRVETFSKVVAPGMELGTITTSPVFYEALLLLSQSSSQAASGLSQAFATKLMFNDGLKGWCRWTASLRKQYQLRRDHMCALLDQEFGTTQDKQLASWTVPRSGMLIRFRIDLSLLPTRYMKGADTTKDITTKLWIKLAEAKVLIVPGWAFGATPAIAE